MRFIQVDEALYSYVLGHANPAGNEHTEALAVVTAERFGDAARMNVGPDQGAFLEMLVAVSGAKLAVEVGTFTGMSALWIARGLPADGKLICCDITDAYLATAQAAWAAAGVSERIEFRVGPAAETLQAMPEMGHIDFAFIDADKAGYITYLDELLPRLSPNGVIAVDNVLWSGRVVDTDTDTDTGGSVANADPNTTAIRAFNDHVAARTDIYAVILPIGDGVTLIRKRTQ